MMTAGTEACSKLYSNKQNLLKARVELHPCIVCHSPCVSHSTCSPAGNNRLGQCNNANGCCTLQRANNGGMCENYLLSRLQITLSTHPVTSRQRCRSHFMLGSVSKYCMGLVAADPAEGSAWGVLHRATLPVGVPAARVAVAAE